MSKMPTIKGGITLGKGASSEDLKKILPFKEKNKESE